MKQQLLNKTTTEIEEEKYCRKSPIRISKMFAFLMLAGFFSIILNACSGKHHSCSPSHSSSNCHSHACNEKCYPGIAYEESCQAVFLALDPDLKYAMENLFVGKCRDLTDEEIENAPNGPGSGYHDSQEAAEDANKYASDIEVFQMDDDTIIIIEDDEVNVV